MATKNILTARLQQKDAANTVVIDRTETITDSAPTAGDFRAAGNLIDTSEITLGLPVAQTRQVWIQNTHATNTITVKWTPNGGAKVTVAVLGAGAAVGLWDPTTGASAGVSLVTLTASGNNTTFEVFLGG